MKGEREEEKEREGRREGERGRKKQMKGEREEETDEGREGGREEDEWREGGREEGIEVMGRQREEPAVKSIYFCRNFMLLRTRTHLSRTRRRSRGT